MGKGTDDEFIKEWSKTVRNTPQNEFARKIGARIVELIKRDPLSKTFAEALQSKLASLKAIEYRWPELPGIGAAPPVTVDGISLVHIYGDGDSGIPDNVRTIAAHIERKWYCEIKTTVHNPIDQETSLAWGYFPVHALWCVKFNILSPVEVPIVPIGKNWPLETSSPIEKLPIFIDLSIIDRHDIHLIKAIVAETVKARLKEYKASQHKETPRGFPRVFRDKYLMFLYHTKERTFQNYIRWYDLHMEENCGWRLIAFLENYRNSIGTYEQWLEKLRTTKWPVRKKYVKGEDVISEDAVAKGVKPVCAAIDREPCSPKKTEPVMEEWNCPEHGNSYDSTCRYCKALFDKFERIHSMAKGYVPTADDDGLIDETAYTRSGRLPRRTGPRRTEEE